MYIQARCVKQIRSMSETLLMKLLKNIYNITEETLFLSCINNIFDVSPVLIGLVLNDTDFN